MAEQDKESESTRVRKSPRFEFPMHKKISYLNRLINNMEEDEAKCCLEERGLDPRGVIEVLQRRLKTQIKKEKLSQANLKGEMVQNDNELHFYCVIDFEGTCEEDNPLGYVHEIIEFPAVLVDANTLEVVSEFHEFVKPQQKPKLSQFCQNLTGVTQEIVDSADHFPAVLFKFQQWLTGHELGTKYKFGVVTDGPWDMSRFFSTQCKLCSISVPNFAREWINLRKLYRNFYKIYKGSLRDMVSNLGLKFEGTPHSGIDDARNITRILQIMVRDGCEIKFNEQLLSLNK